MLLADERVVLVSELGVFVESSKLFIPWTLVTDIWVYEGFHNVS